MAAVDASLAEWLKAAALYAPATDAGVAAAWGVRAIETEIVSPFAERADAEAEAARQLAFLSGPLVLDRHVVDGQRRDLLGRTVAIDGDDLDYPAGVLAFVIRVEELDGNLTALDVLRRLA